MERLLKNKIAKCIFVYLIPVLIGGVFSAMGTWDYKNDDFFWQKLVADIILLIWYVFTSYKYSQFQKDLEEELNNKNEELDNERLERERQKKVSKSYLKETRALSTLCLDSSNSINELAKNILQGKRTLDIWNFTKVSTGICNSIYEVLCNLCSPFDEFTVNVLLDDVTASGKKKNYTMIAHKGKFEDYPSKFQEKMYYKDNENFYATRLFKNNKSDIKILTSREEVNERFVYCDEEHPAYNQYIGIPIVCSGNKMICLLQICALGDNRIAHSKDEILDIVKIYILPFVQFALLNYKVEKGFVSAFSMVGKKEVKIDGE